MAVGTAHQEGKTLGSQAAWVDPPLFLPSQSLVRVGGATCPALARSVAAVGLQDCCAKYRDEVAGGVREAVAAAGARRGAGSALHPPSALHRPSASLHRRLAESGLPAAAGLVRRGQIWSVCALGRVFGAGLGK